jgi:HK97 family phage major capsid protein
MKTSKLYKEERAEVIEKMESLVSSAEGRDLTSDEQSNFDSLNEKVEELNKMAVRAESFEKLQATKAVKEVTENTPKEIRDYSFQEAMNQAATGRLSGLVKEMDAEARNEARYTGQSFKGIGIPSSVLTRAAVGTSAGNATEVMAWTDQLEANLVLASAGANFYSGIANQKFPVFSAINSGFVGETGGSAPAANGTATSVTLSPKKCISIVNVSAEAIAQNTSIEAALQRNMAQSVAATLELALLGDSDISDAPTSIFLDAATQSVAGAAPTIAELLNMEATLLGNGVNLQGARMAWLLDSGALAEAKQLAQVSSVSPAYDNVDKSFLGYFAFSSSNVGGGSGSGTNYMLLDASKVHICQFGGLDVIYDIYTNAGTGEPRYILTSLVDGDMVQNDTAAVKIANA